MNEFSTDFWKRVKTLIKQQNTTQEGLALSAKIDCRNLKQQIFHKRMPSADEAVRIAVTLHTTVEYLVSGEKNTPDNAYKEKYENLRRNIQNALNEE